MTSMKMKQHTLNTNNNIDTFSDISDNQPTPEPVLEPDTSATDDNIYDGLCSSSIPIYMINKHQICKPYDMYSNYEHDKNSIFTWSKFQ